MEKVGIKFENERVVHQYIDTDNVKTSGEKIALNSVYGRQAGKTIADARQFIGNRMTYQEYLTVLGIRNPKQIMFAHIEKVIFNNPATIVIWTDGTKTVVKSEGEKFDPEKGLAMAITKKLLGNNQGYYYDIFKKWLPKKAKKQSKKNK